MSCVAASPFLSSKFFVKLTQLSPWTALRNRPMPLICFFRPEPFPPMYASIVGVTLCRTGWLRLMNARHLLFWLCLAGLATVAAGFPQNENTTKADYESFLKFEGLWSKRSTRLYFIGRTFPKLAIMLEELNGDQKEFDDIEIIRLDARIEEKKGLASSRLRWRRVRVRVQR